jgi:uncharacterized membrane protein (UPF0127 family)
MCRKNPVILIILFLIASISVAHSQDRLETITIKCAEVDLAVEIAADTRSRDRGLMHRESLPDNTGMLLVYNKKRYGRLWMKNTLFPLSAAFIDEDGKILQIIQMKKTNSTKIYRSKEKIKYVIEAPLGWFSENGVRVGDYCSIPDISAR